MPTARSHPPVEPEPHLAALDEYEGKWVAVKDDRVVEAAETSSDLAHRLHQRHIRGAIFRYVPHATGSERVGIG